MTAAEALTFRLLLVLATLAELARLHRQIADLEDDVAAARARVEEQQDEASEHALHCTIRPPRRVTRATDLHLPEPREGEK